MQASDCGLAKMTRYPEAAVLDSALVPEAKCPQNCWWCGRRCGGGRLVSSADDPSPSHHLTTRHSSPRGPSYNQAAGGLPCSARTCHLAEEKLSSQSCLLCRVDIARGRAGQWTGGWGGRTTHFTRTKPAPTFLYLTHKSDAGNCMTAPDNRRADNGGNS